MMELLLGKPSADRIKEDIKNRISSFNRSPKMMVLMNEEDSSSVGYVNAQIKVGASLGIEVVVKTMKSSEEEYIDEIERINKDDSIDACMITRPLFKGANELSIFSHISPSKDVDCMNPLSLGDLFVGKKDSLAPATSRAIIEMVKDNNIEVEGKNVLVIGRSISVGKPVAMLLLNMNATVTIAHSKTKNLDDLLLQADIVVASIGKQEFIDAKKCKDGVIILDAGIHYLEDKIVGDVKLSDNIGKITKVPGGVGSVTSACLMDNVTTLYERRNGRK